MEENLVDMRRLDRRGLDTRAQKSDLVTWQGREALRLENGLALIPDLQMPDATVEVLVGAEGPAYAGVAFRVADVLNYELAYAVPHASGLWDALQYDPVFHGSNTWQVYHGACYQGVAQVPTGRWFRLRLDVCGDCAALSVDDQPPLVVEKLARATGTASLTGRLGLWAFRPAYFCNLRVRPCAGLYVSCGDVSRVPMGTLTDWFLEGYGAVACEPNGTLNLGRYLPVTGEARLLRRLEVAEETPLALASGFSDALTLTLDGETIFNGEHTFHGFADRPSRGYIEPGQHVVERVLSAGTHTLGATLRASEPFGWGLTLAAHGEGLRWLPVELG